MPVISNNSTSSLPFFVENQILRANDLNALVQGLMEQLRQNRTYNIGIGIVNGLNVTVEDSRHIKVTTGFGISSDGYTFETNECVFTYIRSAESLTQCKVSSSDCEEYRELIENMGLAYELTAFDESDPNSSPDEINTGGWQEIEEFPITATDNTITIDDVEIDQGFCLLFIWCEEEVARTSCFNDCEQKGADQNASLKVVLFPRKKYEEIYGNAEGEEELATEVILPAVPRLPRFGFDGDHCIQLCEIEDWNDFYNEYQELCKNVIEDAANPNNANNPTDILGLYNAAYLRFYEQAANAATNPFDGLELFLKTNLIDQKYTPNAVEECLDIQYLYTYLQELLLAYEEFRAIANGMTLLGNSNDSGSDISCLFPKHISLGAFTAPEDRVDDNQTASTGPIIPVEPASAGDPPVCRSDRRLPDVFPQTLERKEKALALFERMVAMVKEVNVLLPTSEYDQLSYIGLTPDIRRFPYLNSKAIPFYYNNLTNLWRSPEALYPSVFQYLDRNSDHILFSEVEPYDFYRIEGHLGRSLEDVLNKIEDHKSCFNIAFDVRAVRIGPGNAIPPDMELEIKDLEIAFQNTRNGLINQLEVAEQHELMEGSLEDITELLEYIYVSFTTLGAITSPYDDLQIDCCSGSLPTIPAEYLEDFTALFDGRLSIDGKALDETIGNCIRDLAIEYHQRVLQYEQALRFSCFAQAHPGLEHLGGVPRGGTFVIVYKESENRELSVVADFCLPYLCCSEGVVIRNEIRKINNELVIPKVIFCFDTATTPSPPNDPIVGTVAPFGGDLTISSLGGNEDFPVTINQSDGSFAVTYEDLFGGASPEFEFSEGEATLIFTYEVGGATPESKTVTINKKPVLNCAATVEKTAEYDEVCNYLGFTRALISFNPPISLDEFDSFTICYQDDYLNPVEIPVKTAGEISTQGAELLTATGELANLVNVPLFVESPDLILKAEKGNCGVVECSVPLPSKCPTELRFVRLETTINDLNESIEINTNALLLNLQPDGNPGYFALQMAPTGLNMSAEVSITYTNGSVDVYEEAQIIIPNQPLADLEGDVNCNTDTRYYVIYDKGLATEASDANGNLIFSSASIENIDQIIWDNVMEYTIKLTYTAAGVETLTGCEVQSALLTISNPLLPQPEPIEGDDENREADTTSKTDDTNTTENTTSTDNDTDTTGARGISSALLSTTGNQLSAAAGQLLNQRRVKQMDQLNRIRKEQADIAKLAGFKHASNLISMQADEASLEAAYRKALNPLFTSYTKTEDKDRKATLEKVIVATHHALLDKLTAQAQDIGTDTLSSIAEQMKKTAAAGISLTKLKRSWKAAPLRKVFDKERVNLLNGMIKA